MEDSRDFVDMSLQDLVNALQAVEQRQVYRQEGLNKEAFVARFKGKSKTKNFYKGSYEGRRDTG